jgi:hypothetical protein
MVRQSTGLINDIPTCDELLDRMGREATEIWGRTSNMFNWMTSAAILKILYQPTKKGVVS